MMEFRKADYKKASEFASELLITTNVISSFPFEIRKFVKEHFDITLCSFKKAKLKNVKVENFGSKSAVWQEIDGMNIIFYNQDEIIERIRFSIAHELGHYVMNHITNLDQDDELYQIQEHEANTFAAQLLMPYQLLDLCVYNGIDVSVDFIRKLYGASNEASSCRKMTMEKISGFDWRIHGEYDDIINYRYSFILKPYISKKSNCYDFEDEYEKQKERDSWYYR